MIYMLLTDGFEDIEALETLDILRRAGLDTKTVSISGASVQSAHNVPILSDQIFEDTDFSDMTMLILPGGAGHTAFLQSGKVLRLIENAYNQGIYIAAICASPSVIGKLGLLKGKRFTCFPGFENKVIGSIYSPEKVVCDGKFITARGAGAASDFGFEIVKLMKGEPVATELKKQMQY
ncbi:MAG: DJ-1/PfpI family protein [Clostridia bacterium]|nr:DJ-1/PfpI family protein [Clostridia bacterium]